MNYQDVKTFQELAKAIKEHIDSHRIPCTDVLRGEGVMYVNANKLSTTDARLAFIRLKNKFSVELPVPNDLIELLDSCGDADRKLQDQSEPEKQTEPEQKTTPVKRWWIPTCIGKMFEKVLYIFTKSFWDSVLERWGPK